MKIVVIGGTGRIGSNVVVRLRKRGHEVVAAAPETGVDTITGKGLAAALVGADAVLDVSNSPSNEDEAALAFFRTSGRNLLAASSAAKVKHYIALSIVGADRLKQSGYMRAKLAQESLIAASGLPYTILRSTPFFEFTGAVIASGADGDEIRISPALVQPIAADDTAAVLADVVVSSPANGMVEVAGPELFPFDEQARRYLAANGDRRHVIADAQALYFGSELDDHSLTPGPNPRLGMIRFADWLEGQTVRA